MTTFPLGLSREHRNQLSGLEGHLGTRPLDPPVILASGMKPAGSNAYSRSHSEQRPEQD